MVRQNVDVDRVILLCHDKLIRFYQRAGFVNHGPSQVPFGSGGWFNMVCHCGFALLNAVAR